MTFMKRRYPKRSLRAFTLVALATLALAGATCNALLRGSAIRVPLDASCSLSLAHGDGTYTSMQLKHGQPGHSEIIQWMNCARIQSRGRVSLASWVPQLTVSAGGTNINIMSRSVCIISRMYGLGGYGQRLRNRTEQDEHIERLVHRLLQDSSNRPVVPD